MSARPATVPRALWTRPSARRVRALRDRLRLLYGRPLAPPHRAVLLSPSGRRIGVGKRLGRLGSARRVVITADLASSR